MRKNIMITIGIIIFVIGFMVYRSPDENRYWLEETPQNAIAIGRTYAFYLLSGNKQGLLDMSVDPARTRIEKAKLSNFLLEVSQADIKEMIDKKQLRYNKISFPLLGGDDARHLDLVALERIESFVVTTFAYKDFIGEIVEIPGRGKMLFSIAVRYYQPIDERPWPKLFRKIANLPLLNKFTMRWGTTGRWVVYDYMYKYSLRDYYEWVLTVGDVYAAEQREDAAELADPAESRDVIERLIKKRNDDARKDVYFLYEWGDVATKTQIDQFESLYGDLENIGKNDLVERGLIEFISP